MFFHISYQQTDQATCCNHYNTYDYKEQFCQEGDLFFSGI